MTVPEVGLHGVALTPDGQTDPIMADWDDEFSTLQWHGAEVRRLPDGAVTLASNPACAVQAMRWGKRAYSFQYHAEIGPRTVADWALIPAYRNSLARALGPNAAEGLAVAVVPHLAGFGLQARAVNQGLMALAADG